MFGIEYSQSTDTNRSQEALLFIYFKTRTFKIKDNALVEPQAGGSYKISDPDSPTVVWVGHGSAAIIHEFRILLCPLIAAALVSPDRTAHWDDKGEAVNNG